MATFARSDDLRGAEFVNTDLRGARFVEADLSGVVMRGVRVAGADIDAPWLFDGESFLRVNGVDVIPLVEAELNRRLLFATATPSYAEVLEARAGRVAMVRDFLATVTPDMLAAPRKNPHDPGYQETTLSCLHVILEEEWEHLRYAVRDLDAIEAGSAE